MFLTTDDDDLTLEPRMEMLYTRLESAASQLAIQHQDDEWMMDQIAEAKELVEGYIDAYERGSPFWTRDGMASFDQQIDALIQAGKTKDQDAVVTVQDVVGRQESWPLTSPGPPRAHRETFSVRYCVHQHMTHMSPKFPESMMNIETPLGIIYGSKPKASGWPLADLEAAFRVHQAAWQQSVACRALADILSTSTTTTTTTTTTCTIRKIVCFGLGRLDDWAKTTQEKLATSVQRAATQHAAALAMAETLTAAQGDGVAVRCYTQEPAYADMEKALLANLGFTVLEDPKGFLEVDEHTLVFSVMPNVPVRQIVADMARPAAMVWNEIEEDREMEAHKDYRMEMRWGEEMRIS